MKWSIPERIIERGRSYADAGRVVSVTEDQEQLVWYAEVLGSEVYYVELDGTAKEADVCTCPFWLDNGYCKHTVAVELDLRKKGISRLMKNVSITDKPSYQPVSLAKMLTNTFSRLQEREMVEELKERQELKIEIIVETIDVVDYYPEKNLLGLTLKVGENGKNNRVYIVKNVAEFLTAYERSQKYKISNQHIFHLRKENFSEENQHLLDQYVEIFHSNQMIGNYSGQLNKNLNKRYLLLPVGFAKSVIEDLSAMNRLHFQLENRTYSQITFAHALLPITFQVVPAEDGSRFIVENRVEWYWEEYQWVISQGTIVEMTNKQQMVYISLMQLLKRVETPEIFYEKEEVKDLFGYVLPAVEEIGTVKVAESIQSEMIQVPLKSNLFFFLEEGQIQVRVDYQYDEVVFSTDAQYQREQKEALYVVRNQVQEQRMERLLEHHHFHKGLRNFSKPLPVGEKLYRFFKDEVPKFRKIAGVEVSSNLSELFLDALNHQPTIQITEQDSWLDIRFDISDIEEHEIDAIMNSLLNNETFHQLENGQVISLESELFQQTSEALLKIRQHLAPKQGHIEVPKYHGLQVGDAFQTVAQTSFSQDFQQMVRDLTHPDHYEVSLPKGLKAVLRNYQKDGFRWLKMLSNYQFGGILADDMGLGKTIQTIAYLLSEKEEKAKEGLHIIVAPASLVYNWQIECQKFAPELQTVVAVGAKEKRRLEITQMVDLDIVITSYATLRQDIDFYKEQKINCLILDEAQMVKNATTKTFQALKELKTKQRFALSGTPIENNIDELWALFQMLMPGFFPTLKRFKQLPLGEVTKMIQPFVLRREKSRVLHDLPDKIETNLYSALTDEQKRIYLAQLRQMQQQLDGMDHATFNRNRMSILAGLTRLRQICCDPKLFMEEYQGSSGKLEQLKEMLQVAGENKRRVLIFSQFTSMLSIIEEMLHEMNLTTFYLRGSTKPKERIEMVEAFNKGEKDIFLISLKAGGTGLNLTGADTVILYDLWWNPAVEEQATGRAHRIGQKKVVEVWRLIAEGTIEEKMYQLQNEKRALFNQVLNENEPEQLAKLTEEDIRGILSFGDES